MSLIKSISGIRGTIGGDTGDNLTPIDIVKFTAAYVKWLQGQPRNGESLKVVVGRDARISGECVMALIVKTLQMCGVNVVNLGLSTTPTVEFAVIYKEAHGGIIVTASHNPQQWNALKLLNARGEFLSKLDGEYLLKLAAGTSFTFADVDKLGKELFDFRLLRRHINAILELPLVDVEAIAQANLNVVIDNINSVGCMALPRLLKSLGVTQITEINDKMTGRFAHNPEPLPENLIQLAKEVKAQKADLGIVVDPDVDRLAFVCEDGSMFGEEYTLVAVADYVLQNTPGNVVSNLSSTRALRDVAEKVGCAYTAAAVGEVNVVEKMKAVNAVIGGEGNGGVIYPPLHYGRDALVGIALFLSHYVKVGKKMTKLRGTYPAYFMSKNKIALEPKTNVDAVLRHIKERFADEKITDIDGIKIDFERKREWVQLRKSNTEAIIRIYAESPKAASADQLAQKIMDEIKAFVAKG
ncbi:phosphoglucomutase [Bacteroidia bacterium]|nr:phosphoglucomutase [Bacteroidia bacterium]